MENILSVCANEKIVVPPVKYDNSDITYSDLYLGHLFPNKIYAQRALDINEMLKNIDFNKEYTFQAHSYGKIISEENGKMKYQIIYPNQKHQFCHPIVAFDNMIFQDFLDTILYFMKNIAEMNDYGVYHTKINESNIFYNNYTKNLTLVNFTYLPGERFDIKKVIEPITYYWDTPEICYVKELLNDIHETKTLETLIYQILSSLQLKQYLSNRTKKNVEKNHKKIVDFFVEHTEWYKKNSSMKIQHPDETCDEYYRKIFCAILELKWYMNDNLLNDFFSRHDVLSIQDSWGLGIQLFIWLYAYSLKKLNTFEENFLHLITTQVCEKLLNPNMLKRATITCVYDKIKKINEKNETSKVSTIYESLLDDTLLQNRKSSKLVEKFKYRVAEKTKKK
jgi:hypothetical protein